MSSRPHINFNAVAPEHRAIDARLYNWGRWHNSGWGAPSSCPMFRMVPPSARGRSDGAPDALAVVDSADASKVATAVQGLPDKERRALNWLYVRPTSPRRACEALAVSLQGLFDLIVTGRQMLINRGL